MPIPFFLLFSPFLPSPPSFLFYPFFHSLILSLSPLSSFLLPSFLYSSLPTLFPLLHTFICSFISLCPPSVLPYSQSPSLSSFPSIPFSSILGLSLSLPLALPSFLLSFFRFLPSLPSFSHPCFFPYLLPSTLSLVSFSVSWSVSLRMLEHSDCGQKNYTTMPCVS